MSDLGTWLEGLGLGQYATAFAEHKLSFDLLPELTEADLRELGVLALGDRKRLLQAIAALAPAGGASKLAAAGRAEPMAEPERRQLTVVFCDLVGSTALSRRFDPEDFSEIIRIYQDGCAAVIARFDGYIARYVGDGLLIYFGYPHAHEDDAERALRAGLEIIDELGNLELYPGLTLQVRVGVATGLAVVGVTVGQGAAQDQIALGETPNLAARLQSLAEPNTLVTTASTRRLAGGLFEYFDLGWQELKGFSDPIPVWRVVGLRQIESRFEAVHATGLMPLVGREQELEWLLERWRQAQQGEGRVAIVAGEAGIGKSRIAQALRERIGDRPHARLLAQCSPHATHSPLHPFIHLLERAAQFERGDSAALKLGKLEAILARSRKALADTVPVVAALLGVNTDGRYPPLALSPVRLKEQTLAALVELFFDLNSEQPLLFILEDVHWLDPSSLEFLERLVERVKSSAVLMVLTCRPPFEPPWRDLPHVGRLALRRFNRQLGAAMIKQITGGKPLPADVFEHILAKTNGVPLFVEELTKAVLEGHYLHDVGIQFVATQPLSSLAIPATLQDSLMARLDQLAPAKEIACTAAVIGRVFSYELLAAVVPISEHDLQSALVQLLKAGLIYRRGLPPHATYTFKHALIQDAAYESILRRRRRQLHARIAEALETRFPEIAASQPELLARHYQSAAANERAISYWHKAGQRAIRQSALVEAVDHLRNGLTLLKSLPESQDRARVELELQTTLGPALLVTKGYAAPEVEATYSRARALCEQFGDGRQLFFALRGLWAFYFVRAELQTARELSRQLLALAERENDAAFALEANRALGMSALYCGEFAEARRRLEQGYALYDARQHRDHAFQYGNDPGVVCLAYGALALCFLGEHEQALASGQEALRLARALGHPFSATQALALAAMLAQHRGDVQATLDYAEETLVQASVQGFPYWSAIAAILRGWALAKRGQLQVGEALMREGLMGYRATGAAIACPWFLGLLAEVNGWAGQSAEGLRLLDEALLAVAATQEGYFEAELQRLYGELARAERGNSAYRAAEMSLQRALDCARGQQAKTWELRSAISLARLWRDQGRDTPALELLAPVRAWFGGITPDVEAADALLRELRVVWEPAGGIDDGS